jgi:deazaflavin-dependent oxidoreductase (nitroreductase family)
MTEAKLAPNLPKWMVDHSNRYIASGGTDGHIYTVTPPGYAEMHVPSLLLTTTGRKSGEKFIFPLFYGETGASYIIVASKGGAPEHPGWYKNLLANPDVERKSSRRKRGPRSARNARGFGQRRWNSGRPMRITRRRPIVRSRSWCSTPSLKPAVFDRGPRHCGPPSALARGDGFGGDTPSPAARERVGGEGGAMR